MPVEARAGVPGRPGPPPAYGPIAELKSTWDTQTKILRIFQLGFSTSDRYDDFCMIPIMELGIFSKRERHLMQMRLWREKNRDRQNELAREWRAKNPERSRELSKESRKRHWSKFLARQRKAHNTEKHTAAVRRWRRSNPGVSAAVGARRRAAKLRATPPWVDHEAINKIYQLAAFMALTVDHIEPLQGKNACGLHVPWNLQLLTARENSAKGNRSPSENLSSVSYLTCVSYDNGVSTLSQDASKLQRAGSDSQ